MYDNGFSNYYKITNWYAFYQRQTTQLKAYVGKANQVCIECASLSLPKLITRIHASNQLAETPLVNVNGVIDREAYDYEDLEIMLTTLFAYGTIVTIPSKNKKGEVIYEILTQGNCKNLQYYEDYDELVFLSYIQKKKLFINGEIVDREVTYKHTLIDGVYYLQEFYYDKNNMIYLNGNDGTQPISIGKMLPKVFKLKLNADVCGVPVYANAASLIIDADKIYIDKNDERELLKSVVAVPGNLINFKDDRGDGQVSNLSQTSRIFLNISGFSDDNELPWQQFGGGFSPQSFIDDLNFTLHMISLHSGLGSRYLSYDKNTGVKTATEVKVANTDFSISKDMLNKSTKELVEYLFEIKYYFDNLTLFDGEVIIEFQDNVILSDETKEQKLFKDYTAGVITKEFYFEQSYKFYDFSEEELVNAIQVDEY